MKFVKKRKRGEGAYPKPAKIHRRHQHLPEHARTISRNVDEVLEVERGDANRPEFFLINHIFSRAKIRASKASFLVSSEVDKAGAGMTAEERQALAFHMRHSVNTSYKYVRDLTKDSAINVQHLRREVQPTG